jgi:2,4-diketo-3-deoxy-L-fuconate hydrolase
MRLIRFGEFGKEKPGILIEDKRLDLSEHFTDWDRHFFESDGIGQLREFLEKNHSDLKEVDAAERWGAPIARPGKVLCIGLNYSDHAKEAGKEVPTEPILFMKGSNTVVGPKDDIKIPRGSEKTDWEVELGVVIGERASYLDSTKDSENHIAGYVISHDVSERHFQLERQGQWVKGKSCDTFNPVGPWLATPDEIDNVNDLNLTLSVNGKRMQNGNTKTMVFDVKTVVHYLSQFMTLEGGDLISTGTPPGVAMGMDPSPYLKEGDVVELTIEGLGKQRSKCVSSEKFEHVDRQEAR